MAPLLIKTPLDDRTIAALHAGDQILLSGVVYTARDAAHKRFAALIDNGETLPLSLAGQVLYYCGPTPAKPGRPIGSAGPTTSARMDIYTPGLLAATGLKGMIGKGERGSAVIEAIKRNGCIYFAATGGVGTLLARSIVSSSVVCYEDLGPEAVYRLEVKDFPLVIAIDSKGNDLFNDGPREFAVARSGI